LACERLRIWVAGVAKVFSQQPMLTMPSDYPRWNIMSKQLSVFGFSSAALRLNLGAVLVAAAVGANAQTSTPSAAPAATAITAPMTDLGNKVPDAIALKEGLFPEDMCEELIKSGFKCMGFKPATTFSLSAVAFAIGSAALPDSLKQQLDVFADVLKGKTGSTKKIRIVGHADSSGDEANNLALSQRRAEEVKRYLVNKGVDAGIFDVAGVGSKDLLKPEAPTAAENRRVTVGR
jgi:outer membrane protein OmpA-like peptidoglycan-associated protein